IEPIDFNLTDTEVSLAKVRLLTAAATYFNTLAVSDFGGRVGPAREPGLVEQVIAAAFQTYQDEDPHPGPFDKAAMLLRGITQGHPFNGGNKRTGFLVAAYYLELAGNPLPRSLPIDDVVELCVRISAGELRDVEAIAQELQRLWGHANGCH
ncbi:MAG: type II toxin-antitoxin system death-on-curing family toxin, partial [Chloroflexota bacterium]